MKTISLLDGVVLNMILLAAGKGERLRPLTNRIPKCLLPVGGKPILAHWLELCETHDIPHVFINTHHKAALVHAYLDWLDPKVYLHLNYEEDLLGTAGTVKDLEEYFEPDEDFVIAYADVLTNINLRKMIDFHQTHGRLLTMGLYEAHNPQECGIVEIDNDCIIQSYFEKPEHPKSRLANAGIYVANSDLFHYIPEEYPQDFGCDIFPNLIGGMVGYKIDEYLIDIGTIGRYLQANDDYAKLN